jgi:hypothetical protein
MEAALQPESRPRSTKKTSAPEPDSSPTNGESPPSPPPPKQFRGETERWWRAIGDDPQVTGTCHHVALMISTEARRDTGTRAMISVDRIVRATGVSEKTVRRYTQQLQKIGYLKLARRGHRLGDGKAMANVYDLCFPGQSEISTGNPDDL